MILLCFSCDLECVFLASAGSVLGEISSPTHQPSKRLLLRVTKYQCAWKQCQELYLYNGSTCKPRFLSHVALGWLVPLPYPLNHLNSPIWCGVCFFFLNVKRLAKQWLNTLFWDEQDYSSKVFSSSWFSVLLPRRCVSWLEELSCLCHIPWKGAGHHGNVQIWGLHNWFQPQTLIMQTGSAPPTFFCFNICTVLTWVYH